MFNFVSTLLAPIKAISTDPRNPLSPFAFQDLGSSKRTNAGEVITPNRALTLAVYFACVRAISEDIAKLPICVYRKLPGGKGKEELVDHPLANLLDNTPNPDNSSYTFRETMTQWALSWGNGFAEIVRNGAGEVKQLWPIHPSRVRLIRREGRLIYQVGSDNDPATLRPQLTYAEFAPSDILHIRGMGSGLLGYSIASYAAETIGIGLAAQTFGASFFGQGSTASGILTHPGVLKEDAKQNLRDSWQKTYGGAKNSHKVAILEEGLKWERISIPNNESQFIETRQFEIEEVCRWFRVSPHKVQHLLRATFSNIEHQGTEHATDCLGPWMKRWEKEVKRSLIVEPDVYVKHDANDLMRGDSNARANWYRTMVAAGIYSINEVREMEDENPIEGEGGDEHFMQINMAPVGKVASGEAAAKSVPDKAAGGDDTNPAGGPKPAKPEDQGARVASAEAQVSALAPVFLAEADRVLRREAMAFQRQVGKPGVGAWAATFFKEQPAHMVDSFGALCVALSTSVGNTIGVPTADVGMSLEAFAQEYCAEALASVCRNVTLPASHTPDVLSKAVINIVASAYKAHLP